MRGFIIAIGCIGLLGLVGCGSSGSADEKACVPGEAKACPCPGVYQECKDDGSGFTPCDCGNPELPDATGDGGPIDVSDTSDVENCDCKPGQQLYSPCGFNGNGTEIAQCENGSWGAFDECDDPDQCKNGDEQTVDCGDTGSGTQTQVCNDGHWSNIGDCVIAVQCGNGTIEGNEECDDGNTADDDGCSASCALECHSSTTVQGIDFRHICGGTFEMGCTAGQSNCIADEQPAHTVTLTNDFWMGETEVTQGQWQALMGNNPSGFGSCGADCPVETVNLWEVASFTNALSTAEGLAPCYTLNNCTGTAGAGLSCSGVTVTSLSGSVYDCEGYRLPTEAEWEYAARAGTDLVHAGSNVVGDVAWYKDNSGSTTHSSATLSPNAWGLYDMSGNVWEWAWDWYDSSYYSTSPSSDPEGPATSPISKRVSRGGAWSDPPSPSQRVSHRNYPGPATRFNGLGFRPVRTLPADKDN